MASSANLVHLTDQNWEQEVVRATIPVLVDFSATWCGPCRLLAPIIEKLADELAGKVKVGEVDTDESPNVATKYSIRSVPTVIVFVGGEIKARHLGHTTRENLLKLLRD